MGASILVLIDSGVSHNFVSPQVVTFLNLEVDHTKKLAVRLGDGHRVFTIGKCLNVPLQIGELTVTVDAYILELGGVDVILGLAWLQSLGKITMDYREMSMSFTFQDLLFGMRNKVGQSSVYDLQGFSLQGVSDVSFREVEGWLWHTEISIHTEHETKLSPEQYKGIIQLLEKFSEVFQEVSRLPLNRNIVHSIVLQERTTPISMRPYRYLHHHKTEIEQQVNEMLQQGIIHHSSSPFSSPVILVKKKDNTWRMCVDYRALNKATG